MGIIRITRAVLVEDGKPVYGKPVNRTCTREGLEAMREELKAELAGKYLARLEVDLQYIELEG